MGAEDEGREEQEATVAKRRFRKRYLPLIFTGLLLIALLVVWTQRMPIAANFIDRELARRDVDATYRVAELGLRRQRIADLVIGDPDDPDLTADWAEIRIRLRFGTPEVTGVTASGVRLKGELVGGELHFGQVDRLLPAPSGEPIKLPALDVTLHDARVDLATPYGRVLAAVAGSGPINDGFAGQAAIYAPTFAVAGCRVRRLRGDVKVVTDRRRPSIEGPVHAADLRCPDQSLSIDAPRLAVDATFSESFDRWGGEAGMRFASLAQGGNRMTRGRGVIDFDGSPTETRGRIELEGGSVRLAGLNADRGSIAGHYRLLDGGSRIGLDGDVRVGDAAVDRALYAGITQNLRAAEGTPIGPAGEKLATAIEQAGRRFDATASLVLASVGSKGSLRITQGALASRSGARLAVEGGDGLHWRWPQNDLRIESAVTLAGGGFPDASISLRQTAPGAALVGLARIAPIVSGDSRLEFAPVSFTASRTGRTRIDTRLRVSGPIADGRVDGLELPLTGILGRGGAMAFGASCVPLSFRRLTIASLTIGPSRLPLCPLQGATLVQYAPGRGLSGGGRIARLRLNARLGSAPLAIAASDFRLPLDHPRFVADNVAVRLGAQSTLSTLDFARLEGDFISGGVSGDYAGGAGLLYNVPIQLSESDGSWRFVRGVLDLDGNGTLTSTRSPVPMFEPLATDDLALHLEDNIVHVTGGIDVPKEAVELARVDLTHDLTTGRGGAVLDTPRLEFNQKLLLSDVTPILVGIVADVDGLVSGTGRLAWGPAGLTSRGTYQLTDVDLAASFGPVRGLNTTLEFTDLLGLNTAPGQLATVREINPGVLVENGDIRYQLLSANRIAVAGARWPFAGGEIVLEPTVLDFGADQQRRLTFSLIGVDAWQFTQDRDFESIAATGIFDGELPMIFDQSGGHIEGGILRSRDPGGTFSYEGEISDVNLGVFGTLAFNALELVRYDEMLLTFDGDLDGEMLTNVDFTGVTPKIQRAGQNFLVAGLTRQLASIPIRFDITLRAPFRGLFYSIRLLDDPTFLVTEALASARQARARQEGETGAEQDVQPPESGNMQ